MNTGVNQETTSPQPGASLLDPFETIEGIQPSAWAVLVYGIPGVGKSTLGTYAPKPFFLDLENGLKTIKCSKNKRPIKSQDDVIAWLRWFIRSEYETIVIDTVDKIEEFLSMRAVTSYNRDARTKVRTVAAIPYGGGGDLMLTEWRVFIDILEHVTAAGKNVLLTGHEQIVKFDNPSDANYDYYTVNVHKKAAPSLVAKMDAVFFARFETVIRDKNDQKGKGKASTTGDRIVETSQGASWVAKNRYNLPETMPLNAEIFGKIMNREI